MCVSVFFCLMMIFLLLSAALVGCNQEKEPEETKIQPYDSNYCNVSDFYIQYLEYMMTDISKAAQMVYFPDNSEMPMFLQCDLITSYEILRFEKLSDTLWVIETCTTNPTFPDGIYGVNYVGVIDGNMLVYRNLKSLPNVLTEGLDIEEYKPHGPGIVG